MPGTSASARARERAMAIPVEPPPSLQQIATLQQEVRVLASERDALILAHNYERPEIQDVADRTGDSFALSREAAASEHQVIVFCGVHFMAETAAILAQDRTVLIPDIEAGCSLAETITAQELRAWKAAHPGAIVVMYVNTTAAVKAEADYCCTSSNAAAVVEHIFEEHGPDVEVLFGPDRWLGTFVRRRTGRGLQLWGGECHVHGAIGFSELAQLREAHPQAELMIHPECRCIPDVTRLLAEGGPLAARHHVLSTGGMLEHARRSDAPQLIVATEIGMLHPLRKQSPGKQLIPVQQDALCQHMKLITLPKLRDALRDLRPQVRVPPEIAARARRPLERMLAIS